MKTKASALFRLVSVINQLVGRRGYMHIKEVLSGYLVEKESLWHTDIKPQKFLIDNMLMNRSSSGQTVRMNAPLFFMHIFLTMWPVSYMTTGVDNHPKCPSENSVRKTISLRLPTKTLYNTHYASLLIILLIQSHSVTLFL